LDTSSDPRDPSPDQPATSEPSLDHLLEEHQDEALADDLAHQGLVAPPPPPDHDLRHALPLRPNDQFTPDPHPVGRDIA